MNDTNNNPASAKLFTIIRLSDGEQIDCPAFATRADAAAFMRNLPDDGEPMYGINGPIADRWDDGRADREVIGDF